MSSCIYNDIYILFRENGIINNSALDIYLGGSLQLDPSYFWLSEIDKTPRNVMYGFTKRSTVVSLYNEFIESGELVEMFRHILSSSVLIQNILQYSEYVIEVNNKVLEGFKILVKLINFISTFHKDKNAFLDRWKDISDFITILTNFDEIHACIDLHPRKETNILENQCYGKIVFIYSDSTFSFKKQDTYIGIGITNKSCSNSRSQTSIHIFGSSLVQVVYPTNNYVDERGMFVILNKNQEENTGIGEIISFRDLITREVGSYHLVGICSLDKTEQPNPSLHLCRNSSITSRIRDHSNHSDNCFVLMISLPMSDPLIHLFLQSTPWNITKKGYKAYLLL